MLNFKLNLGVFVYIRQTLIAFGAPDFFFELGLLAAHRFGYILSGVRHQTPHSEAIDKFVDPHIIDIEYMAFVECEVIDH